MFDKFKQLYNNAPKKLKNEIDKTKDIKQNPIWHPEVFVNIHIQTVTNRLHNTYHNDNLDMCGFLHDLGKIYTTKFDEIKQNWTAPDHEDISVEIVNKFKDWIIEQGCNIELITFVVKNHMRFKYFDDMKQSKKDELTNNKFFRFLVKFNSADYGGTELVCRELKNI